MYTSTSVGESWGVANDGEWRTGKYLVEGVKVIKCFDPRMLTLPLARVTLTIWNSRIIRFLGIYKNRYLRKTSSIELYK